MKYTLPDLAYALDALEPYIDAKTMEIHHSRHHQAYVDNLNVAIEGHDLGALGVDELVGAIRHAAELSVPTPWAHMFANARSRLCLDERTAPTSILTPYSVSRRIRKSSKRNQCSASGGPL